MLAQSPPPQSASWCLDAVKSPLAANWHNWHISLASPPPCQCSVHPLSQNPKIGKTMRKKRKSSSLIMPRKRKPDQTRMRVVTTTWLSYQQGLRLLNPSLMTEMAMQL